jgi:alcohol dehydrogenase (NADP+)
MLALRRTHFTLRQRIPSAKRCFSQTSPTRIRSFTLNTGAKIPAIGVGTFQDVDAQEDAVALSLKRGLRLVDTARVYDVEKQVGQGIKKSGVPREEVFLITKLWSNDHHPDDVPRALDDSLKDLDTPYVDLLLMHYPTTFARGADRFPRDAGGRMLHGETTFVDTWKAMEGLLKTQKVKAIGVSNFSKGEIETLIKEGSVVSRGTLLSLLLPMSFLRSIQVPAVHQMEVHPYLQQKLFNHWLRTQGIHVIQFSPLGNMNDFYRQTGWSKEVSHMMRVIDQPVLKELGLKYGKSPVQIVLAWGVNCGRSVIPKSVIEWQIDENVAADFEIEEADMERVGELDVKARFNDPSFDHGYRLYSDLEGIEDTVRGSTH